MPRRAVRAAHALLTSEDEGRVCRDIPESACQHQPENFLIHVVSLAATKLGDGLSDPKLVLSWLLGALGAPAGLVGLLVPVREAGALLPQLAIAASIRALPVRKWVWVAGSVVQGLCVLGMAAVALALNGAVAGWTVLGLLAVFALARSLCSVSHKDVLGKTVSKATRGTASGSAGTLAAAGVLLAGAAFSLGWLPTEIEVVAILLMLAGLLWLFAAGLFAALNEEPGATGGGGNALSLGWQQLDLLRSDAQLRRFIGCRILLMATALSPPFMLALAGQQSAAELGALGPYLLAAGIAALISSYIWGRLSDRSSRRVLILGGLIAAAALAVTSLWGQALIRLGLLPVLLFVVLLAHQGVRLGRATHLVDMATPETRASYTALSNTLIGAALTASAGLAWLAQEAGYTSVIGLLAAGSLGGAIVAAGLHEVQRDTP